MSRLVLLTVLAVTLMACADSPRVAVQPESQQPQSQQPESEPAASAPATGPIPVEPDGGIGDGAGPPAQPGGTAMFGVSSETDSSPVAPFAYCLADGAGPVLCADGVPEPVVDLSATAQLVVTFDVGELTVRSSVPLTDATESPEQEPLGLVMENPGIWLVDLTALAPTTHSIWLSWYDGAGLDAHAVLDVTIQP